MHARARAFVERKTVLGAVAALTRTVRRASSARPQQHHHRRRHLQPASQHHIVCARTHERTPRTRAHAGSPGLPADPSQSREIPGTAAATCTRPLGIRSYTNVQTYLVRAHMRSHPEQRVCVSVCMLCTATRTRQHANALPLGFLDCPSRNRACSLALYVSLCTSFEYYLIYISGCGVCGEGGGSIMTWAPRTAGTADCITLVPVLRRTYAGDTNCTSNGQAVDGLLAHSKSCFEAYLIFEFNIKQKKEIKT